MPAVPDLDDQLAEALRLLPSAPHGRAAVTRNALPCILAAQHRVSGGQVLLRIPAGQIEAGQFDGTVVAYEANTGASAWIEDAPAVHLVGTATVAEPAAFERAGVPRPRTAPDDRKPGGQAPAAVAREDDAALYVRLTPRVAAIRRPRTP